MMTRWLRENWSLLAAGLAVTLASSLLALAQPRLLRFLDLKLYDTLTATKVSGVVSSVPIIVDIDEISLNRHGQWPWPRWKVARLVQGLHDLGAAVVTLDVVFPEEDRSSPINMNKDLAILHGHKLTLDAIPEEYLDYDELLSQALSKEPSVLGFGFTFGRPEAPNDRVCELPYLPLTVYRTKGAPEGGGALIEAKDAVCSLPRLGKAAAGSGFFNIRPDMDGAIRRSPMLMEYRGRTYPSLALSTFLQVLKPEQMVLRMGPEGVNALFLDDYTLPLDSRGNLLLRFGGPAGTHEFISASSVLDGELAPGRMLGRIALIGTSAVGLQDIHATPMEAAMPGVEVHATILDNLLQRTFFMRPSWAFGAEVLLSLVLGLGTALLLILTGAAWSLPVVALGGGTAWMGARQLLDQAGLFVSPLYPLLVAISNFIIISVIKYWREERRGKERNRLLMLTQEGAMQSMASLAEYRDPETGGHIRRTQSYVLALATALRKRPEYRRQLSVYDLEMLYKSSPLHDIGKVGVPDHILLKKGRLTEEEFEEMKKHTIYGYEAIHSAEIKLGANTFLRFAKEIAISHQEKWDGSGYPHGLSGEDIPLSGRIMAVADVYDALISRRIYKPPMPHEKAVEIIRANAGSHFDPCLVEVFLEIQEEFKDIAIRFADSEEDRRVLLGELHVGPDPRETKNSGGQG